MLKHRETEAILPKSKNKNKKKGNNRATRSRQCDLPEWLVGSTDNIEDTEVPALANTSHDSDSERPTDVATRKHSIYTHFPKDRNCELCKRTKITRAPCRKRTDGAVPRAEKFGDLVTAHHKVLNEGGEFRNNHRYAVLVQDLATQWIRSCVCKTKTSQNRVYESFSSRHTRQKSCTLTINWNLENLVKTYHGIIVLQHSIDPRRMALLKERYAGWKMGRLRYFCDQALDEK